MIDVWPSKTILGVDPLTSDELQRAVENDYGKTVGGSLAVLFTELKAHNYFVNRDLDIVTT